jgi:hypothetical protein
VSDREQITGADASATAGEFSRTGDPGEREPDSGMQLAQALAHHVKTALLHLRQAENIAEAEGIDLDASEHGLPEAGLFRAAGDAAQDLDPWASCYACARAPAQPVPTGTPGAGATPPGARCPPDPGRLARRPPMPDSRASRVRAITESEPSLGATAGF